MRKDPETRLNQDMMAVIDAIQDIQSRIASTGEPASQLELHELQRLGRQYSDLVERLLKARTAADMPKSDRL